MITRIHREDGTGDKLLNEIKKLLPNVYSLATSRWVLNIECEFKGSVQLEIHASDEDITRYVKSRIENEAGLKRHVNGDLVLQDTIINTIVKNSHRILEDRLQQNPLFDYVARNWGGHACGKPEKAIKDLALDFLMDDLKVLGAGQVLLLGSGYRHFGYSQNTPKRFHGIHIVAYLGLADIVQILVELGGVELDSKDSNDRTPLSWAAWKGHETVVELLLAKAADVDSKDSSGRTSLLWAAGNGHEAVVKLLLEKTTDVDSKDISGWTPLLWAARCGREAVVKLLFEKAVEVDYRNEIGQTPLLLATICGHQAVVELLLEKTADIDTGDNYRRTPLMYAAL
ncbi:MAG: hypothetical protein M1839_005258 [Geoglossum umbratile]|nr:MAG: hypothetical protein M1839_005258 [Geoglossum umbratile]